VEDEWRLVEQASFRHWERFVGLVHVKVVETKLMPFEGGGVVYNLWGYSARGPNDLGQSKTLRIGKRRAVKRSIELMRKEYEECCLLG